MNMLSKYHYLTFSVLDFFRLNWDYNLMVLLKVKQDWYEIFREIIQ